MIIDTVKGSSTSVGPAPTPPPSSEIKDKKYSYSSCGTAWYENQEQYTGESCCKECQDDTHTPYTLNKISWKDGDCYCIDTSRSNCDSDEFETAAGWISKDCTQGRRKREVEEMVMRSDDTDLQEEAEESVKRSDDTTDLQEEADDSVMRSDDTDLQEEAEEMVMRSEDTELQGEAEGRVKRSVDTLTQREITCSSLYQSGQNLYWKYQYQIPNSCWSKSLVLVKFTDQTYFSSQELTAPRPTWTTSTRTETTWSSSTITMTFGTRNTTSKVIQEIDIR